MVKHFFIENMGVGYEEAKKKASKLNAEILAGSDFFYRCKYCKEAGNARFRSVFRSRYTAIYQCGRCENTEYEINLFRLKEKIDREREELKENNDQTGECVCSVLETMPFLTGYVEGRPLEGEVIIKHASFCDKEKVSKKVLTDPQFKNGIRLDKNIFELQEMEHPNIKGEKAQELIIKLRGFKFPLKGEVEKKEYEDTQKKILKELNIKVKRLKGELVKYDLIKGIVNSEGEGLLVEKEKEEVTKGIDLGKVNSILSDGSCETTYPQVCYLCSFLTNSYYKKGNGLIERKMIGGEGKYLVCWEHNKMIDEDNERNKECEVEKKDFKKVNSFRKGVSKEEAMKHAKPSKKKGKSICGKCKGDGRFTSYPINNTKGGSLEIGKKNFYSLKNGGAELLKVYELDDKNLNVSFKKHGEENSVIYKAEPTSFYNDPRHKGQWQAELDKQHILLISMTFQAELDKINKTRKRDRLGQISTPPHIATFMSELIVGKDKDLTDKTVLDPCVGTGNLLIPLRGRGAILVGNDVDKEALEMCKERVPEAILTNCNALMCYNPRQAIKTFQEKIVGLEKRKSELSSLEKLDKGESKELRDVPNQPPETIKQLERVIENDKRKEREQFMSDLKKFRQAEIQKLRDLNNDGQPIYYACVWCKTQEIDEKIGQSKDGSYPLCVSCWEGEWQGDFSGLKVDDLVEWHMEVSKSTIGETENSMNNKNEFKRYGIGNIIINFEYPSDGKDFDCKVNENDNLVLTIGKGIRDFKKYYSEADEIENSLKELHEKHLSRLNELAKGEINIDDYSMGRTKQIEELLTGGKRISELEQKDYSGYQTFNSAKTELTNKKDRLINLTREIQRDWKTIKERQQNGLSSYLGKKIYEIKETLGDDSKTEDLINQLSQEYFNSLPQTTPLSLEKDVKSQIYNEGRISRLQLEKINRKKSGGYSRDYEDNEHNRFYQNVVKTAPERNDKLGGKPQLKLLLKTKWRLIYACSRCENSEWFLDISEQIQDDIENHMRNMVKDKEVLKKNNAQRLSEFEQKIKEIKENYNQVEKENRLRAGVLPTERELIMRSVLELNEYNKTIERGFKDRKIDPAVIEDLNKKLGTEFASVDEFDSDKDNEE
ncbi:10311_t:CDS:10 [Funneliformis geosporum]|nr:10311_t:CDS:10 [Funneliformis geosporum]